MGMGLLRFCSLPAFVYPYGGRLAVRAKPRKHHPLLQEQRVVVQDLLSGLMALGWPGYLALDVRHRAVELLAELSDIVADAVEVGTETHGGLCGCSSLLDVGVVHPTEP